MIKHLPRNRGKAGHTWVIDPKENFQILNDQNVIQVWHNCQNGIYLYLYQMDMVHVLILYFVQVDRYFCPVICHRI